MTKGVLRFMSHEGDTKIEWDPQNDKSIKTAKDKFEELLKKGFKAFRMDGEGKKRGWPITEFPEHAAELLLIPSVQGG